VANLICEGVPMAAEEYINPYTKSFLDKIAPVTVRIEAALKKAVEAKEDAVVAEDFEKAAAIRDATDKFYRVLNQEVEKLSYFVNRREGRS
jgi:hypothetical protein